MAKIAYGECTIINVEEPFSVILSNEAQSIPTDANRKVAKDFICYTDIKVTQGMTPHTDFTIGNISSANGITVTKSSARITFTVKAGTTISADTGTFNIPITLGEDTVTKVFSWCCQKEGAAAKSVKVIAESTVFKSTDGGETFSPDTIRITPTFQGGITFSKWQYSIDSGTTWKDITNGKNGLTISSSTLIVSKTCDLYTNAITVISFKCLSNNSAYYDITTISKLGDSISKIRKIESTVDDLAGEIKSKVEETTIFEVTDENGKVKKTLKDILSSSTQDLYGFKREVKQQYNDLEIGGVNLFVQNTAIEGKYLSSENVEINDASWGYSDYINVGDMDYYIASGFTNLGNAPATCFYNADKVFLSGVKSELANSKESKRKMLQIPDGAVYMRFSFLLADAKTLKIEKGIKSTSYSPSPDDVAHNIKTVEEQTKDMFSWLVESGSSETSLKITNGLIEAITGKFVVRSPDKGSVVIENGAINAESITTDMLSANSITAEKIMADALKSRNYVVGESGSFLNLADGSFDSKYLKWDNAGKVIANDITVVGGSINVNDKFIVNNDGIATLQGATVVGNITAESGKIGKFNLDNLALVTGDTDVTCAGLGGSSQAFWAGSLTMDDAPFRVGYDGSFYSSKGKIAGWEITSDSFYKDTDDYTVYVCPGTNNNKDFLTVHDKNKSSGDEWPFYVHADGWMHCVYGDIGGWNISDSSIYKNGGWKSSSSGSAYFGDYGLSITDKFSVDKNGVLMASDSILSGNVYLSDGSKNIGRFDTGTYNGIKGAALVSLIDGGYSALGNYNSSDNTVYIAAYAKNKKFYVPSDFYVSNLVANDGTIYVSSRMFVSKPIDTNNNTYIFTRTKENYQVSLIGWSVSNNIWIGDYGYGGVRTPASNAFITANNVYKTTSGGNTSLSDERYKHGFKDIPDAFDFIMNLNPCLFKFDDGTSDRYHMGFKAQEVENNMLNTIGDTGLTVKYNFEEGLDVDLDNPDTYILGLRYEEFIAPLIQVVQNQQKQIQDLEKKIAILSN